MDFAKIKFEVLNFENPKWLRSSYLFNQIHILKLCQSLLKPSHKT